MQLEVNNLHMFHFTSAVFFAPYICIFCWGEHCSVFFVTCICAPFFRQALVESIEKTSPKVSCFLAVCSEICLECT